MALFARIVSSAAHDMRSPLSTLTFNVGVLRIDQQTRERIFDPFFSTKVDGMRMGLGLARQAARQLGGDLRLRETLLVVDDDARLCRAVVDELARLGHEATPVYSAKSALEVLFSENIVVEHSVFGCLKVTEEETEDPITVRTFLETNAGNSFEPVMLGAPFDIASPDFKPSAGSPAMLGAVVPADTFFEQVTYRGAIDPANDWTVGWTTNVPN